MREYYPAPVDQYIREHITPDRWALEREAHSRENAPPQLPLRLREGLDPAVFTPNANPSRRWK